MNNIMDPTITISSTEIRQLDNIDKVYSTVDKKIIASRIEKISNKKILAKIFQIVHVNNGKFIESSNGITLNLTSMKNNIIAQIERILDLYDGVITRKQQHIAGEKWSTRLQNTFNEDSTSLESKLSGQDKMFLKKSQDQNENTIYWNGA